MNRYKIALHNMQGEQAGQGRFYDTLVTDKTSVNEAFKTARKLFATMYCGNFKMICQETGDTRNCTLTKKIVRLNSYKIFLTKEGRKEAYHCITVNTATVKKAFRKARSAFELYFEGNFKMVCQETGDTKNCML